MPLRLYRISLISAALMWTMFGFQASTILQRLDAGLRPAALELLTAGMWLLLAVGDVWMLMRWLPDPTASASDGSAPAT